MTTKVRGRTILERTEMIMLRWILGVSLKDKKSNQVIKKTLGWHTLLTNTRGQIAMVRSCDEKSGQKLHKNNYDSRGQRTPQSRTTEEAMMRYHTARRLKKEHTADRKKWRGRIRVADPYPGRD